MEPLLQTQPTTLLVGLTCALLLGLFLTNQPPTVRYVPVEVVPQTRGLGCLLLLLLLGGLLVLALLPGGAG